MMNKSIKVNNLLLDRENPRLPNTIDSEVSIIEYMVSTEQILNILEDIANIGLSPIEGVAVLKEGSSYIVLEGNRRVSALKLLNNPNLLPAYSEKISNVLKDCDRKIEEVSCVVFNSRKEAKVWLERKHSGQQGGIGTKPWSSEQKTRFKGNTSNNTLAMNIVDFAKENEIEEAQTTGMLTTVTRFLANETFRNSIGIKSRTKDSEITIDIPKEDFTLVLKQFIYDVVDKTNKQVGSRANKEDVIEYGNYLRDNYLKDIERTEHHTINAPIVSNSSHEADHPPVNSDDESDSDLDKSSNEQKEPSFSDKDETNETPRKRSSKNPDNRKYIFTSEFYCKTSNSLITKIYYELKSIEVTSLPLSCAIMTRTFIESIMKQYLDEVCNSKKSRDKLDNIINDIHKHLNLVDNLKVLSSKQEAALKYLKLLTERKGYALSPFSLGINAHGGAYPKATDIKTDWMNIEPIIQYLLNSLK